MQQMCFMKLASDHIIKSIKKARYICAAECLRVSGRAALKDLIIHSLFIINILIMPRVSVATMFQQLFIFLLRKF